MVRFARNCSALMGAGEFSTIKTANLAMIQATRQLMVRCNVFVAPVTSHLKSMQVSQTMNAGTAAELKAFEAMGKKDHAGSCLDTILQRHRCSALSRYSQVPLSTGSTPSSTSALLGRTWRRQKTATVLQCAFSVAAQSLRAASLHRFFRLPSKL